MSIFHHSTSQRVFRASKRTDFRGFTIVELLIVIVVIAILAAITIVSYQGIQARARDARRTQDVSTITKALEMYYIDNGQFPPGVVSGSSWSMTGNSSWSNLAAYLVPKYISVLPADPISTPGIFPYNAAAYNYAYYANTSSYCGAAADQMYILVYRKEAGPQVDNLQGACTTNVLYYSGASNYRVVK